MATNLTPRLLRRFLNCWPPYPGAGIRVAAIAPAWRHVRAELRPRFLNRNHLGSHSGGGLYSMTDPFHVLMPQYLLGPDCLASDQAAKIELLKPGRGVVAAEFRLEARANERLCRDASNGSTLLPDDGVEIGDRDRDFVARVKKRLYVRLKKRARPAAAAA